MGNCLSTPDVNEGLHKHTSVPQGQYKAGKNAHDSVHSLDTAGSRDAAAHGTWSSKQPQAQQSFKQQQKSQHSQGVTGMGTGLSTAGSSASNSSKQRKPPGVDLATGKPIPDFNVNGVLDVLHELGSGGSGTTYLCRDLKTAKLMAVKFVPRPLPKAAIPLMMGEVELQAQLGEGHVNIITMRELMLTRTHLGLVMDYASGGALTHRVSERWESALTRGGLHMGELEACYFLRQFISAMDYLHRHKVAHRDLKLDNTLLEDKLGPPCVRICDFGFARAWKESDNMKTAIGTPVYMSPQMLAAKQCASGYSGVKADMWAAGVLLFVMLLGAFPFDHAENLDPNSRQASNEVWLRQQAPGGWRKHPLALEALSRDVLSPDCCELLDGLLEMDEEKRLTAGQVLAHPWMHQSLLPDQQAAWEQLQQEQQQLTQDIALKSDVYKVRLRKQALSAMLAFAGKPPGRNSLLPQPSAALSSNATSAALSSIAGSMTGSNPATAAAAAAAVAAAPAGPAVTAGGIVEKVSAPTVPHSPHVGAGVYRENSIPEGTAVNLGAASVTSATSAGAGTAAAAAAVAAAAGTVAAAAKQGGVEATSTASSDLSEAQSALTDRSQHLSFQSGEGLRSHSLEAKVEAYRQQLADIRAARIAAVEQQQQEQQQQAASNGQPDAAAAAASPGRTPSPFAAASGAGSAAVADAGSSGRQQSQALSPSLSPEASVTYASQPASPSSQQQQQTVTKAGSKKGFGLQKLFSAKNVRKTRSDVVKSSMFMEEESEWDETPDEVWRIPLTSTADPAAYKLSPELSVAAGALASQLQKNGKIEGRGRTNRSSCPVYSG